MVNFKNTNNHLCWRGCSGKETLIHCCWEWKLVKPLWKSVWWFLRTLRINLPQDTIIWLWGIYWKDAQSYNESICSTMFIAALFLIARTWKQPRCLSTEECIKKMWHIYILEYLLSRKKQKKRRTAWIWHANGCN